MEDRELAARAAAGDQAAFSEIYERHHGRIQSFLRARLPQGADAEDLCQEVFYQASRCLESFENRASLRSWLIGIARHQLGRYYRRPRPAMASFDDLDGPAIGLAAETIPADSSLELKRALASCERVVRDEFTEAQREVFQLRFHANRSTKAIAQELGRSNQAVKISLMRARRKLEERSPVVREVLGACA